MALQNKILHFRFPLWSLLPAGHKNKMVGQGRFRQHSQCFVIRVIKCLYNISNKFMWEIQRVLEVIKWSATLSLSHCHGHWFWQHIYRVLGGEGVRTCVRAGQYHPPPVKERIAIPDTIMFTDQPYNSSQWYQIPSKLTSCTNVEIRDTTCPIFWNLL